MQSAAFLKNRVRRLIRDSGKSYNFYRYGKDKYQQKEKEPKTSYEVVGKYHVSTSYVKESADDNARLVSKSQPMLLVLFEDGEKMEKNDEVAINGKIFKVIYKTNVDELNIAYDVSLEMKV